MSLTCKIGENKYHDNYCLLICDGHCIVFSESPPSKKFWFSSLLAAGGAWLAGVSRPGSGTRLTKGGGWTINIKYTHMPKHTVDTRYRPHTTYLHTSTHVAKHRHTKLSTDTLKEDQRFATNFLFFGGGKNIYLLDIYYSFILQLHLWLAPGAK